MLSIEEFNLLKAQNEKLKDQNRGLQETLSKVKTKLNEFADKFDCINDYTDVLVVRGEDEQGYRLGEETAISGDDLTDLEELLRDFTDFVEEIK